MASLIALAVSVIFFFAPQALRFPRLRYGTTDPGMRVPVSRIVPLIAEAQYFLLSDLPIAKPGKRKTEAHGSVS